MTMFDNEDGTYDELQTLAQVSAGTAGANLMKQVTLTAGTTDYVVAFPAGTWRYVRVINNHTTATVTWAINEVPVAAPAANPGVAADWEAGGTVPPGGDSGLVRLPTTLTAIHVLSDTATTPVILNVVKR